MRIIQLVLVASVAAIVIVSVAYFATIPQPNGSTTSVTTITTTCGSQLPCSGPTSSTNTSCLSTTQMQTTSTNHSLVLEMGHMPANFSAGGYQFTTVYNGTGYETSSNGHATVNLGWSLTYNVSKGTQTQTVTFGWAPDGPSSGRLPGPSNSTAFNGALHMTWVATCASLFLEIDTQA